MVALCKSTQAVDRCNLFILIDLLRLAFGVSFGSIVEEPTTSRNRNLRVLFIMPIWDCHRIHGAVDSVSFLDSAQDLEAQCLFSINHPVLKDPVSPIAVRHRMLSWPRIVRPFLSASLGGRSGGLCCCSIKKATCRTSRGITTGLLACFPSGWVISQFSDFDAKGGFGLKVTVSSVIGPSARFSS